MKKNLVIVESPAKAKTIEKFLGKDFNVAACGGHIRDLPEKRLGVEVKEDFKPTYVIVKGKKPIVENLKKNVAAAEKVFLAADPDREGEAICWHLEEILNLKKTEPHRIVFYEITQRAVSNAVASPRSIDLNLVDAQQARRIIDRLVGYKLSPLLWKKVRQGLSAGRVQSVALRILAEREEAISQFKSQEYWTVEVDLYPARLSKKKENIFRGALAGFKDRTEKINLPNEPAAGKIISELKKQTFIIQNVEVKDKKRNPAPPFITSSLQQEASNRLGYNPRKTMRVAQQLYEGVNIGEERVGLITYMRTDSFRVADEALREVREYIEQKIGAEFLPEQPNYYQAKKTSQEAHEAIRPTSVFRHPESIRKYLTTEQAKLYQLIWSRFVTSQMLPAVFIQTLVTIEAGPYLLRASGQKLKFEGFLKIRRENDNEENQKNLPELKAAEELKPVEFIPGQHFTEPPPRYSEAGLIKVLEENGIGRPSTYAPIVATLLERGYVEKKGRTLFPTELGMLTNKALVASFPQLINIEFTARMEDSLDEIAAGSLSRLKLLADFYQSFEKELALADEKMPRLKVTKPTNEICEKCGQPLVIKSGRFGEFLACSGFPKCRYTRNIIKEIGVACPECGQPMVERKSRRGKVFYGCKNYPQCKFASWYKPVAEKCQSCGGMLVEKMKKNELLRECLKCKITQKVEATND